MPLQSQVLPFDDSDWVFEVKYDGFRALAVIELGCVQLISRNGTHLRHSLTWPRTSLLAYRIQN